MRKLATKRLMTCFGIPLAMSLATGCTMEDEAAEEPAIDEPETADPAVPGQPEDVGETEQGLTTLMAVSFEGYSAGSLGSPWSLLPLSSDSHATIEDTSDHGNVLRLQGSQTSGEFLIAKLPFSASSSVVASADINPDSNASFVWSLHGQGTGTYKRRVRLTRWPGQTSLIATSVPSGDTNCGALPSGTWTNVSIVFHADRTPHTFDVLFDGSPTGCTGLEAITDPPFTSVQLMDASNAGWGGTVRVDNVRLAVP